MEDPTKAPTGPIEQVVLTQPEVDVEKEQPKSFSVEKISQLIMYQSGTATVAPTHNPRNFYEQIVFKDDGTYKRLWIWSQYNKTWRYVAFT